ncbi:MAG: M16 family metallopeptidase [Armatimonadota bacterium]
MRYLVALLALCLLGGVRAADPITEHWENGFRLVILPTTSSAVVSIELLTDFSALDEPPAYQGLRQVLLLSMLNGSAKLDGNTIRRKLTAAGGALSAHVHQDMLEFSVTVPASALQLGLESLGEIVYHPRLTDADVNAAIAQAKRKCAMDPVGSLDTASQLTNLLIYNGHPYVTHGQGTVQTLDRISPELVRAAYRGFVTPANTVMAVVGRCTLDQVHKQVSAVFHGWEGREHMPRFTFDAPTLEQSRLELIEAPVKSACVMLTFPVCGATDTDFLTLRVIDTLLGGGTGARLFRTVREQRHLAYEVATYFPSQRAVSHFSLYALTHSMYLDQAKTALVDELARLQTEPVDEKEIKRAKAFIKTHYLLSHQYSAQYAFDLAWYELLGLGTTYDHTLREKIDAITVGDIQRVARAYFTHYQLVVVIPQVIDSSEQSNASLSTFSARVQNQ